MSESTAGVMPFDLAEVPCKIVWPTIGATAAGRLVGRLSDVRFGIGQFFTLGKLLALATIPISATVFFWQLMPYVCRRYVLSNRRIVVRKGLMPADERWIALDEFDAIDIDILPGQQWLHAGDLVFRRGGREIFRLPGVSRPEIFRHTCQTVQTALTSVREVMRKQAVA